MELLEQFQQAIHVQHRRLREPSYTSSRSSRRFLSGEIIHALAVPGAQIEVSDLLP